MRATLPVQDNSPSCQPNLIDLVDASLPGEEEHPQAQTQAQISNDSTGEEGGTVIGVWVPNTKVEEVNYTLFPPSHLLASEWHWLSFAGQEAHTDLFIESEGCHGIDTL